MSLYLISEEDLGKIMKIICDLEQKPTEKDIKNIENIIKNGKQPPKKDFNY